MGPAKWEQCRENATHMVTFIQEGKEQTMPACPTCIVEATTHKIKVVSSKTITQDRQEKADKP